MTPQEFEEIEKTIKEINERPESERPRKDLHIYYHCKGIHLWSCAHDFNVTLWFSPIEAMWFMFALEKEIIYRKFENEVLGTCPYKKRQFGRFSINRSFNNENEIHITKTYTWDYRKNEEMILTVSIEEAVKLIGDFKEHESDLWNDLQEVKEPT
jgi:hypothetical protein